MRNGEPEGIIKRWKLEVVEVCSGTYHYHLKISTTLRTGPGVCYILFRSLGLRLHSSYLYDHGISGSGKMAGRTQEGRRLGNQKPEECMFIGSTRNNSYMNHGV